MSSDYDYDDFDDAALRELDEVEADIISKQQLSKPQASSSSKPPTAHKAPASSKKPIIDISDDSFEVEDDFTFDEASLKYLDDFVEDVYQGRAKPLPTTLATRQTTLRGDILPAEKPGLAPVAKNMKKWDHAQFRKSGGRNAKSNSKGKARHAGEDDFDEESVEFEQFPDPHHADPNPSSSLEPPPMKVQLDFLGARHWIFPLNQDKRDYQYNIIKHALFDNTIVALPTGLGKTFIAGCVMLNFYRWFPEGKVVFLAPTKPLVAQQIDACHHTCGIPGSDAAELTGNVIGSKRVEEWKSKRVFYMTPQTLENDLYRGNCDPRDIVLIVFDEAHKATGEYAYTKIVRFMMGTNPHFRVLALTATPGGTPDAVQQIIDGLHISRIEIRDENSLDLRQYIHKKEIMEHIVSMDENVNKVKTLLVAVMERIVRSLNGVFFHNNVVALHPFYPQQRVNSLDYRQKWAIQGLMNLSELARAMGYLIEGTIGMCHSQLTSMSTNNGPQATSTSREKAKASRHKPLQSDPDFKKALDELNRHHFQGFPVHPKMDCLKRLVLDHFAQKLGEDGEPTEETRAMVFVTFREAVEEIVDALNAEAPLIKATKFIGQGTDKKGKKGLTQNEQLEIVKRFKAGEFNVLVATSIGEEGLDIGEVDLIVCYDAQKTPIRMLQRSGRTGRKRAGVVHVLLSEEREKNNLSKSNDAYKQVQKSIIKGSDLELYGDVPRLLPSNMALKCVEQIMDIQPYVREAKRKRSLKDPQSPKPKRRKRDAKQVVPPTAVDGFVPASRLKVKGKGSTDTTFVPVAKDFDAAGEDGESDLELEAALLPRRTQSTKEPGVTQSSVKPPRAASRRRKRKNSPTPAEESDGSEDFHSQVVSRTRSGEDHYEATPPAASNSGTAPVPVIELTDSEPGSPPILQHSKPASERLRWLVDDDDDEDVVNFQIVDSSPVAPHSIRSHMSLDEEVPDLEEESESSPLPRKRRKVTAPVDISSSPIELQRQPKRIRRGHHPAVRHGIPRDHDLFDLEAEHSGAEVSAGESESDEESESDRQFLNDNPGASSPSYDQGNAYRASLFTQCPEAGLKFHAPPVRRGTFGRYGGTRRHVHAWSSPSQDAGSEPNEYILDSFVVDDDDDAVVYSDSSA